MFYDNAERVELVGSHLIARIPDADGRMKDTLIDLNDCIGNQHGVFLLLTLPMPLPAPTPFPSLLPLAFSYLVGRLPSRHDKPVTQNAGKLRWGGTHVFHDPRVSVVLQKGEEGPVLHATTTMEGGDSIDSDLPLAERIKNEKGNLVFSMFSR